MGIAKCTPKRHERFLISHSLERLFRGPRRAGQMEGRRKYPNDIRDNEHKKERIYSQGNPRALNKWRGYKDTRMTFGTMNIEGENTRRINAEH